MLFFYRRTSHKDSFLGIHEPQPGCWIHAEHASTEDIKTLCALTHLDHSILHDALDRYELPRVELDQDILIFFARHPIEQDGHLYTSTLTMILTPSYFITLSPIKNLFIQHLIQKKSNLPSLSPSEWMLQVLFCISQEFNAFLRKTRYTVLPKEKEMSSVTSEDIYALTRHEQILNQYISSLDALCLALQRLINLESSAAYKQNKAFVEDLLNAFRQSESIAEIMIKNIRSLRDSYQIIFANSLTKTIKLLTALTIIFTVPNIVASIYGMNVSLPLAHSQEAFLILIGMMFVLSTLCGYLFYRKNWM